MTIEERIAKTEKARERYRKRAMEMKKGNILIPHYLRMVERCTQELARLNKQLADAKGSDGGETAQP